MIFDYSKLETANSEELLAIYLELHEFRKQNPITKFDKWSTSKHHFTPKCMGGDDSKDNYIRITNEEHFVAHYILHKIYGGKMTSAFNVLCGGLLGLKSNESLTSIEEIKNLFESESKIIRQCLSDAMSGENNPSYGLYGKLHPTSKVDKSGCNNPRYGIPASEKNKMATSESNKNKVVARDKRTGELVRIDKAIFDTDENYVGCSSEMEQPKLKNTVSCLDIELGKFIRVDKDVYKQNPTRYFAPSSKFAKEFLRNNK